MDYKIGYEGPLSATMGDLDEDGKSDLVVCYSGGPAASVSIFRNSSASVGNINFESRIDYSTGSPTPQTPIGPVRVSIGDLDNDGKLDFAASNWNIFFLSVFRNTGTSVGTISYAAKVVFTSNNCAVSISQGDLDKDGKNDLVMGNECLNNSLSIFRNMSTEPGTINYVNQVNYPLGISPTSISVGDLDGDGKVDLVALSTNNSISIFRNTSISQGVISFDTKVDYPSGINPRSISIGDIDGDGKPDLVVTNSGSNTISVYRNTCTSLGTISFAPRVDYITGINPVSISIGNIDGDGGADLVVANSGSNTSSIFRNTSIGVGTINFDSKVDYVTPNPRSVSIGDLDGDGKADLVVANNGSNMFSIFRNTIMPASSDTDITSFMFAEQTRQAIIDLANHTIDIEVAKNTDIKALVATFTLSAGATAKVNSVDQISGYSANDFTSPLSYTVIA